jgi:UDP-N-acetylmuramate dehydrogenase
MVSPKHANFIQADAGGSAADVHRLLLEVRDEVARRTGIDLVHEVRLVGFEPQTSSRGSGLDGGAG